MVYLISFHNLLLAYIQMFLGWNVVWLNHWVEYVPWCKAGDDDPNEAINISVTDSIVEMMSGENR